MPFTVKMPKLSPTMEEGTIAKWHVKVGDQLEPGQLMFDVATDKATIEYNALDGGYLRAILVQAGQPASVNQPVAIFTEKKDESIEGYKPEGITPKAEKPQPTAVSNEKKTSDAQVATEVQKPQTTPFRQPLFIPEQPLTHYEFERPSDHISKRHISSPLAKKIAKEKGLDISSVKGSGPGGRIVSEDLELATPISSLLTPREPPSIAPGTYEEETLTPMRKVIGQRLQESKSFIPHFYVEQTIDAQPLVAIREQLQQLEIKLSINDLIVRACALTLKKFPTVNSGFNSQNNTIIHFKTVDISIAVNLSTGLITPIVRHADYKNVTEISAEIRALAKRAKEGKLAPEEYKGGSFTVSNLGMFGVTNFYPIINPPQAAILGISGIQDAPVVKNGSVVAGKTMNLTLSCDHRVVDGVAAAEFMKALQKFIENPAGLLI